MNRIDRSPTDFGDMERALVREALRNRAKYTSAASNDEGFVAIPQRNFLTGRYAKLD